VIGQSIIRFHFLFQRLRLPR